MFAGLIDAKSTMLVADFLTKIYFPDYADKKRASTSKSYHDMFDIHLKHRIAKITLRQFRTVDGERLLSAIARDTELGRNSLKHIKSFLSGVFKQAKRLGILNGVNPTADTSIPPSKEPAETHAYSLDEINKMLAVLDEPERTVVMTAALTGLRKGELAGLCWDDFNGRELSVSRSIWNGITNPPKTARSKAPVPVVRELAEALEAHRERMGKLAVGPIFQAGNGKPLNLDNLARRVIQPILVVSKLQWHGWHAFRRGLATNLHALRVDDKTIQAILRHSNISLTMNVYVKSVAESGVNAMDLLGAELRKNRPCNDLATNRSTLPN